MVDLIIKLWEEIFEAQRKEMEEIFRRADERRSQSVEDGTELAPWL